MKLKIFFTIIILFLIFSAFEITGTKLRFGSAYLHDSAGFITTNKPLQVADELRLSEGNLHLSVGGDAIVWQSSHYGNALQINGNGGELLYSATSHKFYGLDGDGLMLNIDSATNTITNYNYTKLGSDAPAKKEKFLSGVVPAVSSALNIAHGITDYRKIINMTFVIRDDSLDRILPQGYNITTGLSTGANFYATSTNVVYITPGTSVNLPGDTIKVTVTYRQ